jgi:hypothetical protein
MGVASPCFLALSESRELAEHVAGEAGLALTPLEERRFDGGEFKLRRSSPCVGDRVRFSVARRHRGCCGLGAPFGCCSC